MVFDSVDRRCSQSQFTETQGRLDLQNMVYECRVLFRKAYRNGNRSNRPTRRPSVTRIYLSLTGSRNDDIVDWAN